MGPTGKSIITALLVTSLLAVPSSAAPAPACSVDAINQLDPLADAYNQNIDQIPGIIRGQVSNQEIDLRIETPDGLHRFAVITAGNGQITEFTDKAADDPTLRVETSESTLCDILTSNNPPETFSNAYDAGQIDVHGVGLVNSVKISLVKTGASVVRWITSLF